MFGLHPVTAGWGVGVGYRLISQRQTEEQQEDNSTQGVMPTGAAPLEASAICNMITSRLQQALQQAFQ